MWKLLGTLLFLVSSQTSLSQNAWSEEEETPEYWLNLSRSELDLAIQLQKLNDHVARNIILFLGDGMGIPTITAGRILKGQLQGKSGEETVLAMDKFQHVGLSKVKKLISKLRINVLPGLTGSHNEFH